MARHDRTSGGKRPVAPGGHRVGRAQAADVNPAADAPAPTGVTGPREAGMADAFEKHEDHASGGGFMLGLLTGTVLGAGLGILLAPKSGSELRSQLGDHAASLGRVAGEQLRRAGEAASGVVDRARGQTSEPPPTPAPGPGAAERS